VTHSTVAQGRQLHQACAREDSERIREQARACTSGGEERVLAFFCDAGSA